MSDEASEDIALLRTALDRIAEVAEAGARQTADADAAERFRWIKERTGSASPVQPPSSDAEASSLAANYQSIGMQIVYNWHSGNYADLINAIDSAIAVRSAAQPPTPDAEAQAREIAQEIVIESAKAAGYADSTHLEGSLKQALTNRIAAALTAAQARQSELEPHKAINLLTALEHQSYRNHPFRPMECGECGMTARIANALRGQLGLEIRAAKPE